MLAPIKESTATSLSSLQRSYSVSIQREYSHGIRKITGVRHDKSVQIGFA